MTTENLNKEQLAVAARVLHALAHPLRMGSIQALQPGEKTVTELYSELGCSQPMMSQQLRILEQQGLVACRKEGTTKHCSIRNRDFLKLFDCMQHHLVQVLHMPGEKDQEKRT